MIRAVGPGADRWAPTVDAGYRAVHSSYSLSLFFSICHCDASTTANCTIAQVQSTHRLGGNGIPPTARLQSSPRTQGLVQSPVISYHTTRLLTSPSIHPDVDVHIQQTQHTVSIHRMLLCNIIPAPRRTTASPQYRVQNAFLSTATSAAPRVPMRFHHRPSLDGPARRSAPTSSNWPLLKIARGAIGHGPALGRDKASARTEPPSSAPNHIAFLAPGVGPAGKIGWREARQCAFLLGSLV